MKNINYVVNGVLAIAVIILFVMQFSKPKKADSSAPITVKEGTNKLPIAYVNVDSLLLNYNYSKDLNEKKKKKYENTRASLNQKANSLQSDAIDFQKKVENNAFLTNERAQQEHQRILKKRDELEKAQNDAAQEFAEEQQKLGEQLRDTLEAQLKIFNADKGFQIILSNSNGDNLLLADPSYDITTELINFLNKNYATKAEQ